MPKEGYAMKHCGLSPNLTCSNSMTIELHSLIKLRLNSEAVIVRAHHVPIAVPWTAGQWPSESLSALASTADTI